MYIVDEKDPLTVIRNIINLEWKFRMDNKNIGNILYQKFLHLPLIRIHYTYGSNLTHFSLI